MLEVILTSIIAAAQAYLLTRLDKLDGRLDSVQLELRSFKAVQELLINRRRKEDGDPPKGE